MTKRFEYEQICSRCNGTGIDPEMSDCVCDCCEDGMEILMLTEEEALEYPDAKKLSAAEAEGRIK